VEKARVGFLFGDRAARNARAVAGAIDPSASASEAPTSGAIRCQSSSEEASVSLAFRVIAMKRPTASRFFAAHASSNT
jgi:hypothetical protein